MSKEFASMMGAISGESIDEKIKAFSDVLDKVTQFAMNSIDQLSKKVGEIDAVLRNLEHRVTRVEQMPPVAVGTPGTAPPPPAPGAQAPPPPRPEPKPMSPVSARSALQGELKALFAKRRRD
ncbi:MAG TPA: hypothetical protein VMV49_12640 [Candidatus Deferrimicrobium sp.]|nr:hypothetical protein [Candidatus Deferrimicrobium sp.]